MSYSEEERDILRQCVTEIVDERFFSSLHEMRKKLALALTKEEQNATKLAEYERQLKDYRKCHDCHRISVDKREIGIQVNSDDITGLRLKPNVPSIINTNGHKAKELRLEESNSGRTGPQMVAKLASQEPVNMVIDTPSSQTKPTPTTSIGNEDVELIEISSSDD